MSDKAFSLRILTIAVFLALSGCASMGMGMGGNRGGDADRDERPLRPVAYVDLPRYMGGWYVIANIPYFAEEDCHDSVEGYALRKDGRIENKFACREKSFDAPMQTKLNTVATVRNTRTNSEWRVPFYRVLRIKYYVIDLDSDYRWAVVGHPSRRYGWILSRTRTLNEETYQGILQRLRGQGYDTNRFAKIPHRQEGGPSFPVARRD